MTTAERWTNQLSWVRRPSAVIKLFLTWPTRLSNWCRLTLTCQLTPSTTYSDKHSSAKPKPGQTLALSHWPLRLWPNPTRPKSLTRDPIPTLIYGKRTQVSFQGFLINLPTVKFSLRMVIRNLWPPASNFPTARQLWLSEVSRQNRLLHVVLGTRSDTLIPTSKRSSMSREGEGTSRVATTVQKRYSVLWRWRHPPFNWVENRQEVSGRPPFLGRLGSLPAW